MIGRVVADDRDHGRMAPPRVVEVGKAVAQPRPEVQQRCGGRLAHPRIAVRCTGGGTLEQGEHTAHLGNGVERRHEVHLRRARIGEDHVEVGCHEAAHERLGADHPAAALVSSDDATSTAPGFRIPSGSNAALILPISASFAGLSSAMK